MRQKVKDHCFPKLGFMEKFLSSNHEGDGFIVGEKVRQLSFTFLY